ncbi:hypothetical protein V8G54_021092 [Vigna mungo]|uniref:Uncharacterized protein n=1 Tax=Vigna mungo TaxID=3915 RepID=A0AAQ3NEW7_VIGMU
MTGTSPLGQSLKITERSRVKESVWSRSKESKRSSQSKHQKVIKSRLPGTKTSAQYITTSDQHQKFSTEQKLHNMDHHQQATPYELSSLQEGTRPSGLTDTRPSGLTIIRPFGLKGTRLFGLPSIQPADLATIRPHRFCLLGSSPGTPGSRTTNHVYWKVLQELLGHGRSILSTRKFSRNSRVTDNKSRLLGGSPGTPGPQTFTFVYWEVLQELLGHGRSLLSTRKFSRNSWVTDNQSRLLGDGQSRLLGGSLGTPRPRTTNLVYWEILQELLGHGQPFMPTGSAMTGTSPLGQNLKITERSRMKESEWSRSKESKRSSQS